jgi:hypothetical protein
VRPDVAGHDVDIAELPAPGLQDLLEEDRGSSGPPRSRLPLRCAAGAGSGHVLGRPPPSPYRRPRTASSTRPETDIGAGFV